MDAIPTFEIEFPLTGPAFDVAMDLVRTLNDGMEQSGFRLEPLVRAHGHLLEPWHDEADAAVGYVYRIHLDPLASTVATQVWDELLVPLQAYGVAVRETTFIH